MCFPRRSSGLEAAGVLAALKVSLLPRSLAARTALILFFGFAFIQLLGLTIHTRNQIMLLRIEAEREIATRDVIIYRHIAIAPPMARSVLVAGEAVSKGETVRLQTGLPKGPDIGPVPVAARQMIRAGIIAFGIPMAIRPHGIEILGGNHPRRLIVCFALPSWPQLGFMPPPPPPPPLTPPQDGPLQEGPPISYPPGQIWLVITNIYTRPAPWRSPGFATAFIVMTILGAAMILWAVRHLTNPVRMLANAAEHLGRDIANAPMLAEQGATEIVTAAAAFNTMAARIRRFVEDRTFLLTAIGHDLRTPITRLKLRAEYMEDDEQRLKMLADLDEMEAMVAATLVFGRDITASEAIAPIDLAILLRTIIDDAADGHPEIADALSYKGPEHLPIQARALSLKRALTNLIDNAVKYGDAARIQLSRYNSSQIEIIIDDDGPGIPQADSERVFEPFQRLEISRNRETGGSGLGLSIARNIIRAHGGEITLVNQTQGLRARVMLPG